MNREVLLNSLEDFMAETDARLAALEAKPDDADLIAEVRRLEMDAYHAQEDLAEAEAKNEKLTNMVKKLTATVRELARQRDNAWNAIDEYSAEISELKDDRNRLRDQLVAAEATIQNASQNEEYADAWRHLCHNLALPCASLTDTVLKKVRGSTP